MIILFTIITLIFVAISGASEAVMDKVQFHYDKSIFAYNPVRYYKLFWDPRLSWENKWTDSSGRHEKFPGSSTIFVFLTDAWHLFKFIKNTSIFISLFFGAMAASLLLSNVFISILIATLSARIIYGLTFTLFFDKILQVKDVFGHVGKSNTPSNEVNSTWMDDINNNIK